MDSHILSAPDLPPTGLQPASDVDPHGHDVGSSSAPDTSEAVPQAAGPDPRLRGRAARAAPGLSHDSGGARQADGAGPPGPRPHPPFREPARPGGASAGCRAPARSRADHAGGSRAGCRTCGGGSCFRDTGHPTVDAQRAAGHCRSIRPHGASGRWRLLCPDAPRRVRAFGGHRRDAAAGEASRGARGQPGGSAGRPVRRRRSLAHSSRQPVPPGPPPRRTRPMPRTSWA